MARAPKTQENEEPKAQTTALVDWEKEMAAQAKVAADVVANIGGNVPRFSVRGGMLSIDDQQVPNNQMGVVIADAALVNTYYTGKYDPDDPQPPTCFAIGREDGKLAPHPSVVERGQAQSESCRGCPMNAFGTAETGKGKACRNRVRLALIKAGEYDAQGRFAPYDDPEHFDASPFALLEVPPTSVGAYATFVKQVASAMRLPPHGLFTKVRAAPDPKVQVRVFFEPIAKAPTSLLATLVKRNREAGPIVEQPFNLDVEEREAPAPRGAKPKPATKRGAKY